MRKIVEEIRSHEDSQALSKLGVETVQATASFVDPHTLDVEGKTVYGKQIVIATGSYPIIPPIEGLKETPFLNNETVFDLQSIPKQMIFIGGGPISCELAQALSRLGSKVTLIISRTALRGREEP